MNHETAHKGDIFSATGLVAGGVAGGLGGLLTGLVYLLYLTGPTAAGPISISIGGGAGRSIYRIRHSRRTRKKYEEYIYDGNILILVDAKLDDKLEIQKYLSISIMISLNKM